MTDSVARVILEKLKHLHNRNVQSKSSKQQESSGQLSFFMELVSDRSKPSQAKSK